MGIACISSWFLGAVVEVVSSTQGLLTIRNSETAITQIQIFNLLGEKVFSIAGNNLTTIDCSFLSPGIYIIQATSGEKTWRAKVVKE